MPTNAIEHFHRGKLFRDNQEISDFAITAHSRGLTIQQAGDYFTAVDLGTSNDVGSLDRVSHGFGLHARHDDVVILSHLRQGPLLVRGHVITDYHCLVVPRTALSSLNGDPTPLFALFDRARPPIFGPSVAVLEPLPWTPRTSGSMERLQAIFDQDPKGELAAQLLTALSERPVSVVGFSADPERRLALAIALRLLLPPAARPELTFATEVLSGARCAARLKFLYADPYNKPGEGDAVFQVNEGRLSPTPTLHPYAHLLYQQWAAGPATVARLVDDRDQDVARLLGQGRGLTAALQGAVDRYLLDRDIAAGRADVRTVAQVVRQSDGLPPADVERYARALFELTLRGGEGDTTLTQAIADKGLMATLQPWMVTTVKQYAADWTGARAYKLALAWSQNPQAYGIRSLDAPALLNQVIDSYLTYLVRAHPPGKTVVFLQNARHDLAPLNIEAITSPRLGLLRSVAAQDEQAALSLLELTARHDAERLPELLDDPTLRHNWPPPLQTTLAALTSQRESRAADLVLAAQSVPEAYSNLLRSLVSSATALPRRLYLMRASVWRELQELIKRQPAIDAWLFPVVNQYEIHTWVNALATDDVAAMARYLVAGRHYYKAVELMAELCAGSVVGAIPDTRPLAAFFAQGWDPAQPEACVELARAVRETRLPPAARVVAYTNMLERSQWRCEEARAALRSMVVSGQAPNLDEASRMRLVLSDANQGSMSEESQRLLRQEVESALAKSKSRDRAGALNRIAEAINRDHPTLTPNGPRAQLTQMFRTLVQQLAAEQMNGLMKEMALLPNLRPELQALQAIQLTRSLLGEGGLAAFQAELHSANRLLERLQTFFEPPDGRGSQPIDWKALERELRAQAVDAKQLQQLSTACLVLAQQIDELEEKKTKKLGRQGKVRQALIDGEQPPAGALDALLRLGGILARQR